MFSPLQPFESAFSSIFKYSREKSQSSSTNVQPSSAVWEFNCTNLKILLRSCRLWLQLFTSLQPFESSMCWNMWVDGSQTVNYQEWQVSALKGNIRHRRNNTSFTLWCLQAWLADCRKLFVVSLSLLHELWHRASVSLFFVIETLHSWH